MPAGASPKREREYRTLKTGFEREGRYPGREEEVAARIVNKQRAERGETKASASKASASKAPAKQRAPISTRAATSGRATRSSSTPARTRASPR